MTFESHRRHLTRSLRQECLSAALQISQCWVQVSLPEKQTPTIILNMFDSKYRERGGTTGEASITSKNLCSETRSQAPSTLLEQYLPLK